MQFPKSNKKLIIIFFLILILLSHALGENNNSALICSSSVTAENEEELSFVIFDLFQYRENILNKFENMKNLDGALNEDLDRATKYFQGSLSDSEEMLWIDALHLKNNQICSNGICFPKGKVVFENSKNTIHVLEHIQSQNINDEINGLLRASIKEIVKTNKLVAMVAIKEAKDLIDSDSKNTQHLKGFVQNKAGWLIKLQKEEVSIEKNFISVIEDSQEQIKPSWQNNSTVVEAVNEFERGQNELNNGNFSDAILSFQNVWEKLQPIINESNIITTNFICKNDVIVVKRNKIEGVTEIASNPTIANLNALYEYKSERVDVLQNLLNNLPNDKKIWVTITPNRELSTDEYLKIVTAYGVEPKSISIRSTIGGGIIGVDGSNPLPDAQKINRREEAFVKKLSGRGLMDNSTEFKLIKGITGIKAKMDIESALSLQSDDKIFLVDPGPERVLEEYLSEKKVRLLQRDVFFEYQKLIIDKKPINTYNQTTKTEKTLDSISSCTIFMSFKEEEDPRDCDPWIPDAIDPPEIDESGDEVEVTNWFEWNKSNPLDYEPYEKCTSYCDGTWPCCPLFPLPPGADSWYFHEFRRVPAASNIWDYADEAYTNLPQPAYVSNEEWPNYNCPGQEVCDEELEIFTTDAHEIQANVSYYAIAVFEKNYSDCNNTILGIKSEYSCTCNPSDPVGGYCPMAVSNCDACGTKDCSLTWEGTTFYGHEITLGSNKYCSLFNDADNAWYRVNSGGTSKMLIVDLDVPAGADFDLYVYKTCGGGWICRPYLGTGQDEQCAIDTSEEGTGWYYLRVNRYSGSGEFTLSTDWKYLNEQSCTSDSQCYSDHCSSDYDGSGKWCCDSSDCAHNGTCYGSGYDTCYGDTREYCSSGTWDPTSCSTNSTDSDGGNYPKVEGYCEDFTGCSGGDCTSTTYGDYCSGASLYERYDTGTACGTYGGKNCYDYDGYVCVGDDRYYWDYFCDSGTSHDYCNYSDSFQESCNTGCSEGGDSGRYDYQDQGWVLDYTGCSGGSCQDEGTQYDYCIGTDVYERYCSGGADYAEQYDCQNYEENYCNTGEGDIYREEWGCESGACSDDAVGDTLAEDCSDTCSGEASPSYTSGDSAIIDYELCSEQGQTSCPSSSHPDACQGGEVIREWYCSGTDATYSDYDCDNYDVCSGSCPGCTYNDYYCYDTTNDYCNYTSHDPDDGSTYCSGCSLDWSIGGDVANCCGDDTSEYKKTRVCDTGICDTNSNDDACCNADNKCAYNSTCYDNAYQGDVDGDSENEYCNNGTWKLLQINYLLGYGGNSLTGQDYNITYTLFAQPAKKLVGTDYNILLGWEYYYED